MSPNSAEMSPGFDYLQTSAHWICSRSMHKSYEDAVSKVCEKSNGGSVGTGE